MRENGFMAKEQGKLKLTPKQELFCKEYIVDFNATQAAVRAGYSKKTAKVIGCQNLTKLNVQQKLVELMKKRAERVEITADRVLLECKRIALSDCEEAFCEDGSVKPIRDIPADLRKAISGFECVEQINPLTGEITGYIKKVKFWNKDRNVEVLFRHLGMFEKDNSQKPPTHITIEYVDANDKNK